jgi:hypothetical protein
MKAMRDHSDWSPEEQILAAILQNDSARVRQLEPEVRARLETLPTAERTKLRLPRLSTLAPALMAASSFVLGGLLIGGVVFSRTTADRHRLEKQIALLQAADHKRENPSVAQEKMKTATPFQDEITGRQLRDLTQQLKAAQTRIAHLESKAGGQEKAADTSPSMLLVDGKRRMDGANDLPASVRGILQGVQAGELPTPSPSVRALLRSEPPTWMGNADPAATFELRFPVATVVLTDRPRFECDPVSGAARYRFTVKQVDRDANPLSKEVPTPFWTPATPLPREVNLKWDVTVLDAEGEEMTFAPGTNSAPAMFAVASKSDADAIAALRRAPASRLALGCVYLRAGLLKEAEREFRRLQAANPKSNLVNRLLRHVQSLQ